MDSERPSDSRHAALASDIRRHVLDLLLESTEPLDAAAIAADVALHISTVRFHLEQLESAGLILRRASPAGTRGRPRILFVAAPSARAATAKRDLTAVLAGALAEDPDGGRERAIRAGEAWSERYEAELAASVDGVQPLMRVLESLGFDPQRSLPEPMDAGGHRIELHACPFRDEARSNPEVVCSVHLGLLRGAARSLGHTADDAGLRPFVSHELCLVELHGDWH